jgi:integrase
LLFAAELQRDLELVPVIAVGLFAGLRMSEIKQLDWSKIDFEHRVIDVDASIAKTRQQRNVDMCDALVAWLLPYARAEGPIFPTGFRKKMGQLRKLAGITRWPVNGLRHSYGSYSVVHYQNPNMTALQMGHATTDTLFRHYRNYRIRKRDAEAYWKIFPSSASNNVVQFAVN